MSFALVVQPPARPESAALSAGRLRREAAGEGLGRHRREPRGRRCAGRAAATHSPRERHGPRERHSPRERCAAVRGTPGRAAGVRGRERGIMMERSGGCHVRAF